MTAEQRVDYLRQKQVEQFVKPSEYIGEKPSQFGSVAKLAGESAPFLGNAIAGGIVGSAIAGTAPATGGASLTGLAPAMAFLFTAEDSKNNGVQQEVIRRFDALNSQQAQELKQANPNASDQEIAATVEGNAVKNMEEAGKGALIGGMTGIATNAAMMVSMANTKIPLTEMAQKVVGKAVAKAAENSVYGATATAGLEGLKMAEGNLEGIKATPKEIAKHMGETFAHTATDLGLLHVMTGAVTGLVKLPNTVRSAIKFALGEANPKVIDATLKANVDAGKITQETSDKVKAELDRYNAASAKVVDGLPPEAHASVAGLIELKDKLIAEQKTKDDSQKAYYEEKIDGINQQIQKTINTGKPYAHEINEISGERYTDKGITVEPPKTIPESITIPNERTTGEVNEPIPENNKSKILNTQGENAAFDKPQRKDYAEGEKGDLEYANDNMTHNKKVDDIIGNIDQEGVLTDSNGNKYGVTITSQGVRVVNLLADGTEGSDIVYRKGKRISPFTPFKNGFKFKPNEGVTGKTNDPIPTNAGQPKEQGTETTIPESMNQLAEE